MAGAGRPCHTAAAQYFRYMYIIIMSHRRRLHKLYVTFRTSRHWRPPDPLFESSLKIKHNLDGGAIDFGDRVS